MNMYLGPKVNQLLPVRLIQKTVALLAALGFCMHSYSQELTFRNPTLQSGTAGGNGAVYRFSNVASNIDALLTINGRSDSKVNLKDPDYHGSGFDKALQPRVEYNNGTVTGTVSWWMEFGLQFVNSGGTTPVNVQAFDVTAIDIDGDGKALQEVVNFYNLKSFLLETPTLLKASSINDLLQGVLTSGTRFEGSVTNFAGIDTTATQVMATVSYQNVNQIIFRLGGQRTGAGSTSAGDRMNSLWFKSFNYAAPAKMLPVKLTAFNAVLVNRQVTLTWNTAQEKNVSHFVIERSTNGADFSEAGMLFTDGDSEVPKAYSFKDQVIGNPAVLYYRLKTVDLDGKMDYSSVRVIRAGNTEKNMVELKTFPNPVVNEIRITIPELWQNKTVTYEVYDLAGIRLTQKMNRNASQTEVISMMNYNRGSYIIKAFTTDEILTARVIKN